MAYEDEARVYRDALGWVGRLMVATPGTALTAPTPCADCDVRALMGHLIGTAERSLGTAEGRSTREIPHVVGDVGDAELADRYIDLSRRIGGAWTPPGPDHGVAAPWGPCSAADAPAGLADSVSPHLESTIPGRVRVRMYGPASVPAEGAGPTERLAHVVGHHR